MVYGNKTLTPMIKKATGGRKSNVPYFMTRDQFEYMRTKENLTWKEIKSKVDWPFSERQMWERTKELGWDTDRCKYDLSPLFTESRELYWLVGLVITDGYLSNNGFQIKLKDDDVIFKLRNLFSFRGKQQKGTTNNRTYNMFSISNMKAKRQLVELGVTDKNKTFNATVPNMPDKYFYDFVRGVMDGDGCFYYGSANTFNFDITSASELFAEQLHKDLNSRGIKCGIRKVTKNNRGRKPCYHIYGSTASSLRLAYFMYANTNESMRMDRKFNKFAEFVRDYYERKRKTGEAMEWVEIIRQNISELKEVDA
jgi:hypothetical protein